MTDRLTLRLPGGYNLVQRQSGWLWTLHLNGEPVRLPCGDNVTLDSDDEQAAAFATAMRAGEQARDDLAKLSDPAAVYVNMLRGTIARPSVESIVGLYGANALRDALPPEKGEEG